MAIVLEEGLITYTGKKAVTKAVDFAIEFDNDFNKRYYLY